MLSYYSHDDRHWLRWERLNAYARIMLFLNVAIGGVAVLYWWLTAGEKPFHIVSDLSVFWVAAGLAKAGQGAQAYLPSQIQGLVAQWAPHIQGRYGWFYPPTFMLLILPMGYVSYGMAYLGFMGASVIAYLNVIRRQLPLSSIFWPALAFPGLWINLLTGQNGLLTAAMASAALFVLPKRQILAGTLIGLLAIKPHLAILFPVALVAAGAWQALLVAAATAGAFSVISGAVLGVETWNAWQHSLVLARSIMEGGGTAVMMPTVFSFLRLLQAPLAVAYSAQILVATGAAAVVWHVWRSDALFPVKAATLMTASLLTTPYLFEYDLAWLGPVLAWIVPVSYRSGWYRYEREVLLAAWCLPLATLLIAWITRIQIGPWVLASLLWLLARRATDTGAGK